MSLRVLLLLSLALSGALGVAHAEAPVEPAAAPVAVVAAPAPVAPVAPVTPVAPAAPVSPPVQYECSSFPVRSTMAMGAFQAPADVSSARLNPTRLPVGWTPMAGSVGEGGAYVVACRAVGS